MRTEFVDVAGLRLRVGRAGAGPRLLLITGIGANLDMWAALVPPAARTRARRVRRTGRRRFAAPAAAAANARRGAGRRRADGRPGARARGRARLLLGWRTRAGARAPFADTRAATGPVRERAGPR